MIHLFQNLDQPEIFSIGDFGLKQFPGKLRPRWRHYTTYIKINAHSIASYLKRLTL